MSVAQEITSLPASRELDALVAEKVMEWTQEQGCWIAPDGMRRGHPESERNPLPAYSTSIAAAWEVLEHLKPAVNFVLFYYGEQHPVRTTTDLEARRPAFCCEIHPGLHVGRAATAPLAIVRAALRAVGC